MTIVVVYYVVVVPLNHRSIVSHSERISDIQFFINNFIWKKISFPSHKKDWKKFETNNKRIAVNVLYVTHNSEEIRHVCNLRHNLKGINQVFLLMITDGEN